MFTITPDQWSQASPYLDEALGLPPAERAAWLVSLQEKDPNLASIVRTLLDEQELAHQEGFLENSPVFPASGLAGQNIGAYTLISQIGRGGMGTVWLAKRSDGRFERQAAVKFVNIALAGNAAEERFKREGSILGRLTDPHIAELLDAGLTSAGQPYLILEYVDGAPIDQYCDDQKLSIDARVRLFLDVLAAIAHAHANLVVHRDIKPSNVLVTTEGNVKLLDFGIAKLLEDDGQTGTATLLTNEFGSALTPQYAAPEQLKNDPVTTATDVYALGVLLYVLLAGQHPAGTGLHSPADLLKAVVETEPQRISDAVGSGNTDQTAERRASTPVKLRRQLRGDLDTIIAKALKKAPAERYASVTALAEDLQRYLKHEPISARPDSFSYRAIKFVRRNRATVALATVASLAVVLGLAAIVMGARTARRQRDFAYRQLARAEKVNSLNRFLLTDASPSGKPLTADEIIERTRQIVERENYTGDPANHVELLLSVGNEYMEKGEDEKALPLIQQAYQLSRGLQDASARARADCALGQAVGMAGEADRSKSLIQEGLHELPNDPQFAFDRVFCLLVNEGTTAKGDAQETLERAQAAERALNQAPFESNYDRMTVLESLAAAYHGAGRLRESLDSYQRDSELITKLGYDETITAVNILSSWGHALVDAGRPEDAAKVLAKAIKISGSRPQNADPGSLIYYARSLAQLGHSEDAISYLEFARGQAPPRSSLMAICLVHLARIYLDQRDFTRAAATLTELEPLAHHVLPPGHFGFATIAMEQAQLDEGLGDQPKALQSVNQAFGIAQSSIRAGSYGIHMLPELFNLRSEIQLGLGKFAEAESDAEQALHLLTASLGDQMFSAHRGRSYLALGRALAAEGKASQAQACFQDAAEQLENTLGADHPDTRTAHQLSHLNSR